MGQPKTTARPWTLSPNWQYATGKLIYSYQSITIPKCIAVQNARDIYNDMKTFASFAAGNIAMADEKRTKNGSDEKRVRTICFVEGVNGDD